MTASWNNPKLTNAIQSDVPDIQTLLAAALKQDPTGTDDIPNGAKRLVSTAQGYELQVYNGTTWASVGKLSHDVQTVDGYSAATGTTASTIPVRTSAGKLEGDITGNAATATTAVTLSSTLGVGLGGTGATTAETARSNLGVPPTDHASSTTSYGIGTSTAYGHVKLTDDTTSQSGAAGGIAATPLLVDTVDSTCLHLSGAETASGVKTFSDGVVANVTGNLTGNASGSASTLATARSITVSLSSSSSASFDGSADVTVGTTGTLPASKGGTGSTSLSSITVGKATADGNGNTITSTYLPLAGGTMTGRIVCDGSAKDPALSSSTNSDFLRLNGGMLHQSEGYGAYLVLYGATNSAGGAFNLSASTSATTCALYGTVAGNLTWGGKEVERVESYSFGSTGYIRFYSGLQICYGHSSGGGTSVNVTFPASFSSVYYRAVATDNGSARNNLGVHPAAASYMTIYMPSGGAGFHWIAIGNWK